MILKLNIGKPLKRTVIDIMSKIKIQTLMLDEDVTKKGYLSLHSKRH